MTSFKGIKVMTRLEQGLLNADVDLDQAMAQVLGDELTAGFYCVARDNLCMGGGTIEDCNNNWEKVLRKLDANNLKVSLRKVRVNSVESPNILLSSSRMQFALEGLITIDWIFS